VHDVHPVRRGQGRGHMVHDTDRAIHVDRALGERIIEAAAAHPSHDEVGTGPIAPVVVQGHHVRMLEARDRLRLLLEPSEEARVVGKVGMDLLHRDLTAEPGVNGPPHDAERPLADSLVEPVAAEGATGELQRRILPENAPLQLL
jgi:hypothetical protein